MTYSMEQGPGWREHTLTGVTEEQMQGLTDLLVGPDRLVLGMEWIEWPADPDYYENVDFYIMAVGEASRQTFGAECSLSEAHRGKVPTLRGEPITDEQVEALTYAVGVIVERGETVAVAHTVKGRPVA